MTLTATKPMVETIDDFFAKEGPLPTSFNEVRQFPRFYFRACAEAIIHPLFQREAAAPAKCFVLTCDLSRSGLSLLHNKQLFPGQKVDIILNSEPARHLEVVWCRRLADGRYAIGCRFRNSGLKSIE